MRVWSVVARGGWLLACVALAGCANRPIDRSQVERLPEASVVQVITPALEVPTFIQAAVQRGILGGAIPGAIAETTAKVTLSPPAIPDEAGLITQKLKARLAQLPWWPRLRDAGAPVPANYVHAGAPWLRVQVGSFYIAPQPVKTLHVMVHVSLRRPGDEGEPYWVRQRVYTGTSYGGERLDEDRLARDPGLLAREIERAATWIANAVVEDFAGSQPVPAATNRTAGTGTTAPAPNGVTAAPAGPRSAPDEDLLGKASGYPYQRLAPGFSLFSEQYKVGNFTGMEKIFWPRKVPRGDRVLDLPPGAPLPADFRYPYEGRQLSVDDLLARQRITGLIIVKDGQVVLERYQYARKPEDHFASFSMAKTVTGMLVGLALADGAIASLDDPAAKYAPELQGSAWAAVSIRNLLRMASGAHWSDKVVPGVETDGSRLSLESFFQGGQGGASAVSRVRQSDFAPGTRFNYSSAESFVLGVVLRSALRRDLAGYLSERVWQPMGAEDDASWLIDRSGLEAANCCLNARLRDYARLGVLLANDGAVAGRQLVPREYLLDATDPARQPEYLRPRRATQFLGYGYQAWLYPFRTRTFEARGIFGQQLIVQPESKVVVVITSALRTADVPNDLSIERNYFLGAVLKALGGKADVYR